MRHRRLAIPCLALALLAGLSAARAHEGHEHAATAASTERPAAPGSAAPRVELSNPRVELVAVRDAGAVLIYLDDYDSNAPLAGLHVQVQDGGRSLQAKEVDDGLYRLAPGLLDEHAHTLTIRIHGPGWDEQLEGRLPAAAVAAPAPPAPPKPMQFSAYAAAALIGLVAVVIAKRRRRPRPTP